MTGGILALQIGVIGGADANETMREQAYQVGWELAKAGAVLITGGLTGVMEAASQGAHDAGGIVVGILPGPNRGQGNPFVNLEIVTNMGHARNVIIAHSADGFIAIGGGLGTLSEIAIATKLGKPLVGLNTWDIVAQVSLVESPEEAIRTIMKKVGARK